MDRLGQLSSMKDSHSADLMGDTLGRLSSANPEVFRTDLQVASRRPALLHLSRGRIHEASRTLPNTRMEQSSLASFATDQSSEPVVELVNRRQQCLSVFYKNRSRARRFHTLSVTLEQAFADIVFQDGQPVAGAGQ